MRQGRILAAFALAAGMLTSVIFANEEPDARQRAKTDVAVDVGQRGVRIDIAENEQVAHVFRGTHLMGMSVWNNQGDKLGTINDLVIDFECRHVRYAAISFGGVLGFGQKLFAVPLSSLALRYDSSSDKPYLLFDVTAERLNESPGFDKDHWPDIADPAWSKDIDKFYGVKFDDVTVGVQVEGKQADAIRKAKHHGHQLIRATFLNKLAVQNTTNEDLGHISDFVINAKTGNITHLVVTHGAVANVGGEKMVVPMSKFTLTDNVADNKRMLVLPVLLQKFKDAPRIGEEWPNFMDEDWSQRYDRYYNGKNL